MANVFNSVHHPGTASLAYVYTRALIRPLGFCLLPVMLVSLTVALQSGLLMQYLWWGVPSAVLVASLWTRYRLSRTLAEIRVSPPHAAARNVLDYLRDIPPEWGPIVEVRDHPAELTVTIGLESFTLPRREWPEADAMLHALINARHAREPIPQYS